MKETRQEAVGCRTWLEGKWWVGEVGDSIRNDDDGVYKAQLMGNQALKMKGKMTSIFTNNFFNKCTICIIWHRTEHRQMCITISSVSSFLDLRMILAQCLPHESGLSELGKGRTWVRNKCIPKAYSNSRKSRGSWSSMLWNSPPWFISIF